MTPSWTTPLPLFVYGTLRRGGRYHAAWCAGLVRAQPATTPGALVHLPAPAGYPALVLGADGTVHGELLTFDDPADAVARIDALEDARADGSGLYLRVAVSVDTEDARDIPAWAYGFDAARLAAAPGAVPVVGGRWTPR